MTLVDHLDWIEPEEWPEWRRRLAVERAAGRLPALRRDALLALLVCLGEREDPSDAEVAERAHCSERTVRRARVDAREAGLLGWRRTKRLVGVGRRLCLGRNVYEIRLPMPATVSSGQTGRARQESKQGRKPPVDKSMSVRQQLAALAIPQSQSVAVAAAVHARAVRLGLAAP